MKATVLKSTETKKGNFAITLSIDVPTPFGTQTQKACMFFSDADIPVDTTVELDPKAVRFIQRENSIDMIEFL